MRAIVLAAKQNPCLDCGHCYHPAVMAFHHRDPAQKVITISRAARALGEARLREEIAKCDLLCANCHRMREVAARPGDFLGYESIAVTVQPPAG